MRIETGKHIGIVFVVTFYAIIIKVNKSKIVTPPYKHHRELFLVDLSSLSEEAASLQRCI